MSSEAGKGDTPRPMVDRKQFESNWETIFGKGIPKEEPIGKPLKEEPLQEKEND